jgi:hypothetical protein
MSRSTRIGHVAANKGLGSDRHVPSYEKNIFVA